MLEIFMILPLPIFRYFFHGPVNAVLLLVIPTAHPFFTPLLMLHPGRASASPTTPTIIHGCRLILKKMLKTTNILLQNFMKPWRWTIRRGLTLHTVAWLWRPRRKEKSFSAIYHQQAYQLLAIPSSHNLRMSGEKWKSGQPAHETQTDRFLIVIPNYFSCLTSNRGIRYQVWGCGFSLFSFNLSLFTAWSVSFQQSAKVC